MGCYDQLCCPASPKLLLGLDLGLGCDNCRKETSEDMVAPVDTSSNNQNKEGIEAHNIRRLDIEEMPDRDIIWNAEDYALHMENESESEEESYWDSSSHIKEENMMDMGHDLDPKEKV